MIKEMQRDEFKPTDVTLWAVMCELHMDTNLMRAVIRLYIYDQLKMEESCTSM